MTRAMLVLFGALLAVPASAQTDMIDFSAAQIVAAPDVRTWPIATAIARVSIQQGVTSVVFSKQDGPDRWPDVTPDGWDGALQYTLWLCIQTPTWTCSGFVQMWYGRAGSGNASDPDVPSTYDKTRYYDARWTPMYGHGPIRAGEPLAVLVTSGNERGAGGPFSVRERSNVVTFAATDSGVFTFGATAPTPPPVVPPPVMPPPVLAPVPTLTACDLTPVVAQLAALNAQATACNQGIASVNQNVTDGRAENRTFFGAVKSVWAQVGGPILKYVVPAVTAFLAGKHL